MPPNEINICAVAEFIVKEGTRSTSSGEWKVLFSDIPPKLMDIQEVKKEKKKLPTKLQNALKSQK